MQCDPSKLVSTFIDKFETQWALLLQLSVSENSSYCMKLNRFLVYNEVKRDILLSILISTMTNIIENISTKPSMTLLKVSNASLACRQTRIIIVMQPLLLKGLNIIINKS